VAHRTRELRWEIWDGDLPFKVGIDDGENRSKNAVRIAQIPVVGWTAGHAHVGKSRCMSNVDGCWFWESFCFVDEFH
jgi:hypothetical protein